MKNIVELPDMFPINGESNWTLARDWCRDRFFGRWQYKGLGVFSFNDERDALLFALRWR